MTYTKTISPVITAMLNRYSAFNPSPLTLEKLLHFGRSASEAQSFLFLRQELPVRFANILEEIHHLPEPILKTPSIGKVQDWYTQTLQDVVEYEEKEPKEELLKRFNSTLATMLRRHGTVVETLGQAIIELREALGSHHDLKNVDQFMQYFLNRFYMHRISCRMLINQHMSLFDQAVKDSRHIGGIDPYCDVGHLVEDAYENARHLCERYYLDSPLLRHRLMDATSGGGAGKEIDKIEICYVPSHLYHILFELMKNSMRAVMEFYGEDAVSYPPLEVMLVKGKEDLTIRLSDVGGGIPRSNLPLLFNYMYSTAPQPDADAGFENSAPLAGYGYGLPLSKLYARYFQGDLRVSSIEGYGTDAYVYLKALSSDASELLPIFNKTSSKFYKTPSTASDWSGPVPGR